MYVHVLSELFIKLYAEKTGDDISLLRKTLNLDELESALKDYLICTISYKSSYVDYMKEVEIVFENLINNRNRYMGTLVDDIKSYTKAYTQMIETHPLTSAFIKAANELYSPYFDIKRVDDSYINYEGLNIAVRHKDNRLEIIRVPRIGEDTFPTMVIEDIDNFERALNDYISVIKEGDSYYNIFARDAFAEKNENEKLRMIFEGLLLNVSSLDALRLETIVDRFSEFVSDKSFEDIRRPVYMGQIFDDELYVMLKRSELWYETPYYLAFMLRNKRIELPNVRLGIAEKNGRKTAFILATQTSQMIYDNEEMERIQEEIKKSIPHSNRYRFYNPTHLVSLVITFGILKGMDIENVVVTDYLPFRFKKVVADKQFNESEADNYQNRLTNKNIMTYFRILDSAEGLEISSLPEMESELTIHLGDFKGKNAYLDNLFSLGYKLGEQMKVQTRNQ